MWGSLKNNIIKFYGIKGFDYKTFEEDFRNGDWYLSRSPINLNKTRMQELLRKVSLLMRGKTKEYEAGSKQAILNHVNELYADLIENYRIIFARVSKMEYAKECRAYADIIGDDLMELRNMEPDFNKLNDYELYKRYNMIRRQIGKCESVLPRLNEAFRTSQVKSNFQERFSELFQLLEDLMSPVQEYDFASYNEDIVKLWKDGKTIPEIAKALTLNPNTLAVHIEQLIEKKSITRRDN